MNTPNEQIATCGECGHCVELHGVLHPTRCDLRGLKIYKDSPACTSASPRRGVKRIQVRHTGALKT